MSNLFIRWVSHTWAAIGVAWLTYAFLVGFADPELGIQCICLGGASIGCAIICWRAQDVE